MKRFWGIVILACISAPVWALSPEGKALLAQVRAKCQSVQVKPPSVLAPKVERQSHNSQQSDADLLGQTEVMMPPTDLNVAPGNFSDLNAVDPTIAHEDGGKLVPGAPKKIKVGKGSKKAQKKGKGKNKGKVKAKNKHKGTSAAKLKTKTQASVKPKAKANVASTKAKQPQATSKTNPAKK